MKEVSKVNDSYFNLSQYNNTSAKRHVLCQEIGHTFGLNHQTGVSCMNDVNGIFYSSYVTPNFHDYEELELIYNGHLDAASLAATTKAAHAPSSAEEAYGIPSDVRKNKRHGFTVNLGNGQRITTYIHWAE